MTELKQYLIESLNSFSDNLGYAIVFALTVAIASIGAVGTIKGIAIKRIQDTNVKNAILIILSMIASSIFTAVFNISEEISFTYFPIQSVANSIMTSFVYFLYEKTNFKDDINTLITFFWNGFKKCILKIIASFGNKEVAKKSVSAVFNQTADKAQETVKKITDDFSKL